MIIDTYNESQDDPYRSICEILAVQIDKTLGTHTTSKLWHGAPVWFIAENPVVGYWIRRGHVQLLFWSGQSFDEPGLKAQGKFKAAEYRISSTDEINIEDINRWLEKACSIQWDYKNIVKRRGVLERI